MTPPTKRDEQYMTLAIEKAKQAIAKGQSPFAAVIVRSGKPLVIAHNQVWRNTDITAHAEVTAIRAACKRLETVDLTGATIYSTTEPCPMCFAACHWARIARIVYGAGIRDARNAGFNELSISNQKLKTLGKTKVILTPGVLREQCVELFKLFRQAGGLKRTY